MNESEEKRISRIRLRNKLMALIPLNMKGTRARSSDDSILAVSCEDHDDALEVSLAHVHGEDIGSNPNLDSFQVIRIYEDEQVKFLRDCLNVWLGDKS